MTTTRGCKRLARPRRFAMETVAALLLLGSWSVLSATPAQAFGSSEPLPIPSISAGGYMSCGVRTDGTAACWGENGVPSNDTANVQPGGAATPPAGTFLEVNAGYATACGVRTNQTLVCWGNDRFGKLLVPSGTFSHVTVGLNYACALRTNGTIACWGGDDPAAPGADPEQKVVRDVPPGAFTQLTLGIRHACALRADGSIRCWGGNLDGQTTVPGGNDTPGLYRYVNVGNFTSCALKTDGSPVCWGRTTFGQQTYPAGATFVTVNAGFAHVCGLAADGTVTCWGRNTEGQGIVPPGAYTQVTTGTFHTCGMPVSGAPARCWGNNQSGRVQPILSSVAPQPGYVATPYSFQFTMNTSVNSTLGGQAFVSPAPTFTVVSGTLPTGLTLNGAGLLSGTPTEAGSFTFRVAASNGLSPPDCSTPSVGTNLSLPCVPGDSTSVATATRTFTVIIAADAPVAGTIAGRVTSASTGAAVSGATVTLSFSGGAPAGQTTTAADGSYSFANLVPGPYNVQASGTGLQPQTKPATVTSSQMATVDFVLGPLARPTVVSVFLNHFETVSDGLFVEWSEPIRPGLGDPTRVARYTVHTSSTCGGTPIATGSVSNWTGARPRTRDLQLNTPGNLVPGGTYYLRVDVDTEFGLSTQQFNALTCVPFTAFLSPTDRSAVSGIVTTAAGGAPLPGATVVVTRTVGAPGTVVGQATTDANGRYLIGNLAPGPYAITAAKPGFTSQTSNVTLANATLTKNFALGTAPVAGNDAFTHYGSDTALVVAAPGLLANDTDADNQPLTVSLVSGPSNGTLTLSPTGSFTYRPNEDAVGTDTFTYRVNDGASDSGPATVTITVGAGCRGLQATIVGTSGPDRLVGTSGNDVIVGLGGNDILNPRIGDDVVCGGSGDDEVNANAGNDYVDGGSGNDTLRGEAGNDTLLGGAGADTLTGGSGNDTFTGGTGAIDRCQGGTGTDTLAADHGCERINGIP